MNTVIDILLIEDSPSQALRFRLMLQKDGYLVDIAADGAEGWRRACDEHPRLILLDIDLPSLNGFQVLARLKRGRATADIPVIMLTHRDHIQNVTRALELGANDYLFKDDAAFSLSAAVSQVMYAASPAVEATL
jgi:DNA-binding response OmpR family regulator